MANNIYIQNTLQSQLEQLLLLMQQLMHSNYVSMLNARSVKNAINYGNDNFFFENNPANKEVNKLLSDMAKQVDYLLLNGIEKTWEQAQNSFWNDLKITFSKTPKEQKAFVQIRETATNASRANAAQSFYNEKRNGFNISDRVWNLAGNAKKEMEIILQNGIKEGKSAAEIQKSLKGYLNNPETLFKRVRNKETDELEWSKAAQKYHPGQGVYRSAYKNAMRLARTEMKAAYCEAVWQSMQDNPLITGYRVVLSNNHTTLRNGKRIPLTDICDELQGEYPKTFKFTGWHPQCRCEMIPILITNDEEKKLYKSIFDGKENEFEPEQIKEVPKEFTEWIEKNKERAKGWASIPRFMQDNWKFVIKQFIADSAEQGSLKYGTAKSGNLYADPLGVTAFKQLYDIITSKASTAIKHNKFNAAIKGYTPEFTNKNNNAVVIVVQGGDAKQNALETAYKFTNAGTKKYGFNVIFGNKASMKTETGKFPDTFIIDNKTFYWTKAEFKYLTGGASQSVANELLKGQASTIVYDMSNSNIDRRTLINGLRVGWRNDLSKVFILYNKRWREVNRDILYDDNAISALLQK